MKIDKKSDMDMTLESRLGLLSFDRDDDFITVDTNLCKSCEKKPCLYVCPSNVYVLSDDDLVYNIEGCIEMGMCTIVCDKIGKGAIKWNHPKGGKGVNFKFG